MQPRILLAFQSASVYSWLMSSFSSTRTPRSFSTGLLSMSYSPSLWVYLGLLKKTLHVLPRRINKNLWSIQPTWSGLTNHTELVKVADRKQNASTDLLLKYTFPIPMPEAQHRSSPKPPTEDITVFKITLLGFAGSCFPFSPNSCAKPMLTGLKLSQHFLSLIMNAFFFF